MNCWVNNSQCLSFQFPPIRDLEARDICLISITPSCVSDKHGIKLPGESLWKNRECLNQGNTPGGYCTKESRTTAHFIPPSLPFLPLFYPFPYFCVASYHPTNIGLVRCEMVPLRNAHCRGITGMMVTISQPRIFQRQNNHE